MYTYLRGGGKARARRPTVRGDRCTVPVHVFEPGKQGDLRGVHVLPTAFVSCHWAAIFEHLNKRTAQAPYSSGLRTTLMLYCCS